MGAQVPGRWCGCVLVLLSAVAGAVPDGVATDRLAQAVLRAQALPAGTGGPLLHAFVDPRCGACALLEQRLLPLIRGGQLRVRWIPVRIADGGPPAGEATQANTALLRLLTGTLRTPTLAYRVGDGALRVQVGAPPDLGRLLRDAR